MWSLSKQAILRRPFIAKTKEVIKIVLFCEKETKITLFSVWSDPSFWTRRSLKPATDTRKRPFEAFILSFLCRLCNSVQPTRVKSTANKNVDIPLFKTQGVFFSVAVDSKCFCKAPIDRECFYRAAVDRECFRGSAVSFCSSRIGC